MKKFYLCVLSFMLFFVFFANSEAKVDHVVIVQKFYNQWLDKQMEIEIFNGSPDEISEFVKTVQKAKTALPNRQIKEAVKEGEFDVQFYYHGELKLHYEIFNHYNANDLINNKIMYVKALDLIPNVFVNSYKNKDDDVISHRYVNYTSDAVIRALGNDYKECGRYVYDKNTFSKTEMDPDYSKYLSEKDYGKEIMVLSWRINNKNVRIWFILHEDGTFVSFDSVEYTDDVEF